MYRCLFFKLSPANTKRLVDVVNFGAQTVATVALGSYGVEQGKALKEAAKNSNILPPLEENKDRAFNESFSPSPW